MSQARVMLSKQIDDIQQAKKHVDTNPHFLPLLGLMETNLLKIADQWDKEFVEEYSGDPLTPGHGTTQPDDDFEDLLRDF